MKQPKKLTRIQKEVLRASGLNWKNWALLSQSESYLRVINKESGRIRSVCRYFPEKRRVESTRKSGEEE